MDSDNLFITKVDLTSKEVDPEPSEQLNDAIINQMGFNRPLSHKTIQGSEMRKQKDAEEKIMQIEERKLQMKQYEKWKKQQAKARVKEQDAREAAAKKRWDQLMEKITFVPPDEQYYSRCPIQPGWPFFEAIIFPKKVDSSQLKINIPDTLYIDQKIKYVHSSDGIQVAKKFQMVDLYESIREQTADKDCAAIMRLPSKEGFNAIPLNWEDFSAKILKGQYPPRGMIQRFVKCHSVRPTVTRIFYINTTLKSKATYGIVLTNTETAKSKYPNGSKILMTQQHDGIEIYHQCGAAIEPLAAEAKKIVEFLQREHYLKIEEIVFDFIKDSQGKWWFMGCKGFRLDEKIMRARELRIENYGERSYKEVQEENNQIRQERLNSVHCAVCRLPYKNQEVNYSLPFKLLMVYKNHTYVSGRASELNLAHLRVTAPEFLSHCARLCEICYMLIIQEYKLVQQEKKLGAILNIPVKDVGVDLNLDYVQPSYMPDTLWQWRILFHFGHIKRAKNFCIAQRRTYNLQFELFGTSFEYTLPVRWHDSRHGELGFNRMFYFFAPNNYEVRNFCTQAHMQFKILEVGGEAYPFKAFSCQMNENEGMRETTRVLLFQKDDFNKVATLNVTVGIAKDIAVNAKKLPISIRKEGQFFIPQEDFITADPLPDIWMDIFDEEYRDPLFTEQILDSSLELKLEHDPQMSEAQSLSPPLGSTQVLHLGKDLDPMRKFTKNIQQYSQCRSGERLYGVTMPQAKLESAKRTDSAKSITKPVRVRPKSSYQVKSSNHSSTTGVTTPSYLSPRVRSNFSSKHSPEPSELDSPTGEPGTFTTTVPLFFSRKKISKSTRNLLKECSAKLEKVATEGKLKRKLKRVKSEPTTPKVRSRPKTAKRKKNQTRRPSISAAGMKRLDLCTRYGSPATSEMLKKLL